MIMEFKEDMNKSINGIYGNTNIQWNEMKKKCLKHESRNRLNKGNQNQGKIEYSILGT